jgi:hypothetical protein
MIHAGWGGALMRRRKKTPPVGRRGWGKLVFCIEHQELAACMAWVNFFISP